MHAFIISNSWYRNRPNLVFWQLFLYTFTALTAPFYSTQQIELTIQSNLSNVDTERVGQIDPRMGEMQS